MAKQSPTRYWSCLLACKPKNKGCTTDLLTLLCAAPTLLTLCAAPFFQNEQKLCRWEYTVRATACVVSLNTRQLYCNVCSTPHYECTLSLSHTHTKWVWQLRCMKTLVSAEDLSVHTGRTTHTTHTLKALLSMVVPRPELSQLYQLITVVLVGAEACWSPEQNSGQNVWH